MLFSIGAENAATRCFAAQKHCSNCQARQIRQQNSRTKKTSYKTGLCLVLHMVIIYCIVLYSIEKHAKL